MLDGWVIWAVVLLALAFDYINGFHDTANAIATSVSTRAIAPKTAVMMAATLNFFGSYGELRALLKRLVEILLQPQR